MSDSMNEPVTRGELREDLATKADKADLVPLATTAELHFGLETWAGALREQLKADAQQREDRLKADAQQREERMTATITATITANITAHVSAEIARHTGAIMERMQTEIGVVDEKYQDVPPRLTNVEAQAHTHTEPPPKKATGRRSR